MENRMYCKINIAHLQLDATLVAKTKESKTKKIRCITQNKKTIHFQVISLLVAYNLNNRNQSMELKQKLARPNQPKTDRRREKL